MVIRSVLHHFFTILLRTLRTDFVSGWWSDVNSSPASGSLIVIWVDTFATGSIAGSCQDPQHSNLYQNSRDSEAHSTAYIPSQNKLWLVALIRCNEMTIHASIDVSSRVGSPKATAMKQFNEYNSLVNQLTPLHLGNVTTVWW